MSDLADDLRLVQYFWQEKSDPSCNEEAWENVQKFCPQVARAYLAMKDAEAFFEFSVERAIDSV